MAQGSTDAVNGGQLYAVDQASKDRDAVLQQGLDTTNATVTANKAIADAQNAATNQRIDNTDAIVATNKATADAQNVATNQRIDTTNANVDTNTKNIAKGISFGGATGSNNYQLGDTISAKGDKNITTSTVNGGVQVSLNPKLEIDSVSANVINTGSQGLIVTGGSKGTVSVTGNGFNNGNNTITNLAAGELSETSTQAVNGSQLYQTNQQVASNTKNIGAVSANVSNLMGQMNDIGGRIDNLNNRVTSLDERLSSGIAGAYAMSSISTTTAGKRGVGFGSGYYNGQSAVAVGFTRTDALKDDKSVAVKLNGSMDTQGNFGAAIGATYFY